MEIADGDASGLPAFVNRPEAGNETRGTKIKFHGHPSVHRGNGLIFRPVVREIQFHVVPRRGRHVKRHAHLRCPLDVGQLDISRLSGHIFASRHGVCAVLLFSPFHHGLHAVDEQGIDGCCSPKIRQRQRLDFFGERDGETFHVCVQHAEIFENDIPCFPISYDRQDVARDSTCFYHKSARNARNIQLRRL